MEALKVTFTFCAPVFIDSEQPIHMDALIASCVARDLDAMGEENAWLAADDLSAYLDKTDGANGDWVWKASRLIFTPASGIMFQNMTRKSDPDKYFADLGKYWTGRNPSDDRPLGSINPETFRIDTRSGQQRGYQWLSASQWMEKAEAWLIGDRDALEDLLFRRDADDNVNYKSLRLLEHLGKAGRNGYGRIKRITVESTVDDEKWRLRVLPSDVDGMPGTQYETVDACIRAPYWKKLNRVICKEPLI